MDYGMLMCCPVFCIADIPASTLNKLLDATQETLEQEKRDTGGLEDEELSHRIVFMTTQDLSSITEGASLPAEYFFSPFLGMSIKEVRDWFDINITQADREGYLRTCFLVLDAQSVQDDSCILVCTQEEPFESLRCDFYMAVQSAMVCEVGESMAEGIMGCFMRSRATMTRENFKLVGNGGLYIEGGEVKVNQAWRDLGKQ